MFSVEEKGEVIEVTCILPARRRAKDPYIKISTPEVLDFLIKEGYNLSSYKLEKVGMCNNANGETNLTDIWSWRKPEPKVAPKPIKKEVADVKSTTRQVRTRKRKQTVAEKDKLL